MFALKQVRPLNFYRVLHRSNVHIVLNLILRMEKNDFNFEKCAFFLVKIVNHYKNS